MKADIMAGPNSEYKLVKAALKDTVSMFGNVENALRNTLETVGAFSTGLNKILDCRIMRKEINDLESGLCFNVRYDLFHLFVFLGLVTLMMILLNCFICFGLSKSGDKNKVGDFNYQNENKQFAKDNKV